ncbi:MAG: hypothetical protein ACW99F_19960 [Candidatus Hodarchaeales archaeon]
MSEKQATIIEELKTLAQNIRVHFRTTMAILFYSCYYWWINSRF